MSSWRRGMGGRALEALYARYNRRSWVHPDPLELLYAFGDPLDREIAGLVASSLAFGRVAQILRSVSQVLDRMGRPAVFLANASQVSLLEAFADFRHRFATGEDLANLLFGTKRLIEQHGSLHGCFLAGFGEDDATVLPALSTFTGALVEAGGGDGSSLVPLPCRGSACKRWHLFLRWMVRRDEVDPGGWDSVPASKLVVPLDTHLHRISVSLGLTRRRAADARTAMEITDAFRTICPEDPVRYDFALTRLGIRKEMTIDGFLEEWSRECGRRP